MKIKIMGEARETFFAGRGRKHEFVRRLSGFACSPF
jgi:hypothetical protein